MNRSTGQFEGRRIASVRALPLLLAIAASLAPRAAFADEPTPRWDPGKEVTARLPGRVQTAEPDPVTDGVYGRFDGDLDLGLGLGAELASGEARGAARLSVHYFSTAGIYATYRDALGAHADVERVLSLGVDLRPAFVPRWSKNMQQGPNFLDLALDSISLGLGAFWEQPRARSFASDRGLESSLGFGIPLFGKAAGPWLESRGQLAFRGADRARSQFLVVLSFHTLALSPFARAQ
jgi:hypothetical protein